MPHLRLACDDINKNMILSLELYMCVAVSLSVSRSLSLCLSPTLNRVSRSRLISAAKFILNTFDLYLRQK